MPAAGYIELILQALEGVPVHCEEIEFLQPCPIPKAPVRLQTALYPVAGAPDEFTFTISSRSYDIEKESTLHCRGQVRRVSEEHTVDVPRQLADIDTTGFETAPFTKDGEFYEHVEGILGDAFQYGPFFRTIQKIDKDRKSEHLLV